MKHYVIQNCHAGAAQIANVAKERPHHIEVILRCQEDRASAELVVEFFHALNKLIAKKAYVVTASVVATDKVGGPLDWAGRTAVFWGDLESAWCPAGDQKLWVSQVMNLSPRVILVGAAVMLLAQMAGSEPRAAAVHATFEAAAFEQGIVSCGASTCLATDGRLHSANTRISALGLLSELVSDDHGQHIADALRRYVGLSEPGKKTESQIANRLIGEAKGDEVVIHTLATMLTHIEDPLSISELAATVGTSVRQLQRRYLGKTNAKLLDTYKELRLERVGILLKYTDMPFAEVAAATGFSSRSAMSRSFFKHFKSTPEESRKRRYLGCE